MGLFIRKMKENVKRDYPTCEEYNEEVKKIQEEELNSNRYKLVCAFLSNYFWNRKNKDLEDELFKIIGTSDFENQNLNISDDYKKLLRLKRYAKLKNFIDSLTEEQIDSNIFLKKTSLFMKKSVEDCSIILNMLKEKLNNENQSTMIRINCAIPNETLKLIPKYISTETAVKYYRPQAYKIDYVDILDSSHIAVYEEYNDCICTISKIAEDIYFLQLNNLISTFSSNLICDYFVIYHPGCNNHFDAIFYVKSKTEHIDVPSLNSKNSGQVLKKILSKKDI